MHTSRFQKSFAASLLKTALFSLVLACCAGFTPKLGSGVAVAPPPFGARLVIVRSAENDAGPEAQKAAAEKKQKMMKKIEEYRKFIPASVLDGMTLEELEVVHKSTTDAK